MSRYVLLCAVLGLGLLAAISPAGATDQGAAVEMCKKNPSCSTLAQPGGINLKVGTNEIWCPDQGECVCTMCQHPQRTGADIGFVIRPKFMTPQTMAGSGSSTPPAPVDKPSGGPIL